MTTAKALKITLKVLGTIPFGSHHRCATGILLYPEIPKSQGKSSHGKMVPNRERGDEGLWGEQLPRSVQKGQRK